VFDGILLTGHQAENCGTLNNDETVRIAPGLPAIATGYIGGQPCSDLPADGKLITIRTQSENENATRARAHDDALTRRLYDVAGVSHIPQFSRSLRFAGATRQNPASWQPVAKAMLRHLMAWIAEGTPPPQPRYLEGGVGADGNYRLSRDGDGNVLGGIRLPHMPSILPNGERAGAPLGVYGGIDRTLADPRYGYADSGGTFEPFSAEELARRYPTREAYVGLVSKAADALLADGYILEEDRDAYIRAAERQPLVPVVIDPVAIIARVSAGGATPGE
jgi:hypothetical protein